MWDDRTNLAQQVAGNLKEFFGEKLCLTTIPRNVRLAEAPSYGKPALLYDVRSRGAESYIRLAKELMGRALNNTQQSGQDGTRHSALGTRSDDSVEDAGKSDPTPIVA
jgi:chromosome partitioning protein